MLGRCFASCLISRKDTSAFDRRCEPVQLARFVFAAHALTSFQDVDPGIGAGLRFGTKTVVGLPVSISSISFETAFHLCLPASQSPQKKPHSIGSWAGLRE